jgi:hypothetical protein
VGALGNYSLVFVIFINFSGQLKDWVAQILFVVSCPKGQVEKYVNVEVCTSLQVHTILRRVKHFIYLLKNFIRFRHEAASAFLVSFLFLFLLSAVSIFIRPSLRRDVLWYTNVRLSIRPFHMSRSNLRTPWPIHFKFHRVIGIDGLTVCILYGEILNFHSRVMGLYSSNCRQLFVCRAVNCPLANSLQTLHSYWNW